MSEKLERRATKILPGLKKFKVTKTDYKAISSNSDLQSDKHVAISR